MQRIEVVTDIGAPAERVWAVLTDFAAFPEWNPFMKSISGNLRAGERIVVQLQPPGGRGMTFKPTLLEVESPRVLRWLGQLGIKGIFDGEHAFEIAPLDDTHCRFTHSETFRGILVPVFGGMLSKTADGFREMNEALKRRAEATPGD